MKTPAGSDIIRLLRLKIIPQVKKEKSINRKDRNDLRQDRKEL
jgi:hypothetical protein